MLITGASAIGKSELALELICRGSGLIADDVVELYRIAPETIEGRCPAVLRDFLEVRGLGVLNIRTIFGETALRPRKNLQAHRPPRGPQRRGVRRPRPAAGQRDVQEVMGVPIRKVTIPVAAGRNLAVLAEAAVRNTCCTCAASTARASSSRASSSSWKAADDRVRLRGRA